MTSRIAVSTVVLLLSTTIALGCDADSSGSTEANGPWASVSADARAALAPDGDMLVPVQHVLEAQAAGVDISYVDARPSLDYEFGHIPGSMNIPYFDPEPHLATLDPTKLYVVYCECPHAEAVQLADEMIAAGFDNVKVIDEGLYGWTQAGGETVGGTSDASADSG